MTLQKYQNIVSALKTISADSPCHFTTPNINRTAALKYQNHTIPIIRPELTRHNENISPNSNQDGNKDTNSSNKFTTRTDLKTAMRKVCNQLRIKINSGKSRQYKTPIFTKNPTTEEQERQLAEIPIIKQKTFRFSEEKYMPTEAELQSTTSKLPPQINTFTVTDSTPPATNSKQLRGINSDLFGLAFKNGGWNQKPIYQCRLFNLTYWHPSYFMGRVRKSKPGVAFMLLNNLGMLNTETLKIPNPPEVMKMNYHPLKRKVESGKTRRLIKKLFFDEFSKHGMIKDRDGTYLFKVGIVAHTAKEKEILKEDIKKALANVRNLKEHSFRPAATAAEDRKLNWKAVWKVCDDLGVPRIESFTLARSTTKDPVDNPVDNPIKYLVDVPVGKKSKASSKRKRGRKGKQNKSKRSQDSRRNM
ncbi:unnamed protein product [Ambrosiozyma monospora]|uniref:Unnamed protein product n=1 Tax=Ambrosiozyma monospora TaxID=43982 RepID=A0ACB5SWQ3_AMBMO|nr:unnamed protein product [Ambrosiozyma monospora]